ncbi:unnamed protein product, partial [Hapterophycus canaliculatus]
RRPGATRPRIFLQHPPPFLHLLLLATRFEGEGTAASAKWSCDGGGTAGRVLKNCVVRAVFVPYPGLVHFVLASASARRFLVTYPGVSKHSSSRARSIGSNSRDTHMENASWLPSRGENCGGKTGATSVCISSAPGRAGGTHTCSQPVCLDSRSNLGRADPTHTHAYIY